MLLQNNNLMIFLPIMNNMILYLPFFVQSIFAAGTVYWCSLCVCISQVNSGVGLNVFSNVAVYVIYLFIYVCFCLVSAVKHS